MKEPALVIIKPDGVTKGLLGPILQKFDVPGLQIVAMRIVQISRAVVEEHYKHLKGKHFFEDTVAYLAGELHKNDRLIAIIYYGTDAIKKCREVAGATNPEDADPRSIRGAFGRITTKGIYENIVHVSSDKNEAEREIKLWFVPDDISVSLYPTKTQTSQPERKRMWT